MTWPRFAAHRGGAALWPENSLRAVRESIALGAPFVEIDVHRAADGALAVIHDRSLERTTDGEGLVGDRTGRELTALRLREPDGTLSDERLPLLEEVLALLAPSGTGLLLEIKGAPVGVFAEPAGAERSSPATLEERLVATLDAHGMTPRTNMIAFNPEVLGRVHALERGVRTTLLVAARQVELAGARAPDAVEWARAAGATDVGIEYVLVDETVVRAARLAHIGIGVWTVNEEAAMRRCEALGVDLVTTDRPDVARRVLGAA